MTEAEMKKIQNLPIYNPQFPNQKYSEKEEKYLREIQTYEFINMEEPGLIQKFPYGSTKNKYTFTLIPGGKYQLPRFIARHVNSKATPDWKWRPNGLGQMEKQLVGMRPRFQLREVY
jgi:hypothetical protein